MIAERDELTVLIHFEAAFAQSALAGAERDAPLAGAVSSMTWFCQWVSEQVNSLFVLTPESLRPDLERVFPSNGPVSFIWYSRGAAPLLPLTGRREQLLMVNGGRLPLVDWSAASAAARRHGADVVVFGPADGPAAVHYPETLEVDDSGEVLCFTRHYFDSPICTDGWAGSASFLATSTEHAEAVVAHVLRRGWGLDSIGGLTRRFSVRWSRDSCVASRLNAGPAPIQLIGGGADLSIPAGNRPAGSALLTEPTVETAVKAPDDDEHCCTLDGYSELDDRVPALITRPNVCKPGASGAGPAQRATSDETSSDRATDGGERTAPPPETPYAVPTGAVYPAVKRIVDVLAAGLSLTVLSPFLLGVGLLVRLTSPGPALFGHRRQGRRGREFLCWKFRTMVFGAESMQDRLRSNNEVDGPQFKIAGDPRLTRLGTWLRRFNIDELPQLINVLLGNMSLVGPRPSPDRENQLCPGWRRTRLSVRPGITGLWQVLRLREGTASDFQEWIYYDTEYARHQSWWLDLQILVHTPLAMFAPHRLGRFVERLTRRGICIHSARLRQHSASGEGEVTPKHRRSTLNHV